MSTLLCYGLSHPPLHGRPWDGAGLGHCGHCFPGASGLGILSFFFYLFNIFRIALQYQVWMKAVGWLHGVAQWGGSKHPPALVPCFWASIYTFLSHTSCSANLIHLLNQIFSSFTEILVLSDGQCPPNGSSPCWGKKIPINLNHSTSVSSF